MLRLFIKAQNFLHRKAARALKREEGATMVEYGLLVALIAVALIATIITLQGGLISVFSKAATQLNNAGGT